MPGAWHSTAPRRSWPARRRLAEWIKLFNAVALRVNAGQTILRTIPADVERKGL